MHLPSGFDIQDELSQAYVRFAGDRPRKLCSNREVERSRENAGGQPKSLPSGHDELRPRVARCQSHSFIALADRPRLPQVRTFSTLFSSWREALAYEKP